MSFGMVMSIANKREEELPDSVSCKSGRIFGDIWSLIGSGAEIGGGSAEAMGGVVLDSSVAGVVVGVPLNISGLAVAADGVINAERSLTSLANDTMSFISNKSSNGGTGKSGSNEGTGKAPDYVKDNRVPLDKETVLSDKGYNKTKNKVKGAQVYKNGDKYYYRDTFHTGEASHLEVFDKRGNHIGEANPQTGELTPGTADPTKKINVK